MRKRLFFSAWLLCVLLMVPTLCAQAAPAAPKLAFLKLSTGTQLRWTVVSSAKGYEVYYSKTAGGSASRVASVSSSRRYYALSASQLAGGGYWKVRAKGGSFSNELTLGGTQTAPPTTPSTPADPKPTTPAATTLSGVTVSFYEGDGIWNVKVPEVANATQYTLYRASSPTAPAAEWQVVTSPGLYEDQSDFQTARYYEVTAHLSDGTIIRSQRVGRYSNLPSNLPPTTLTGSTPYRIVINKSAQVVTAYAKDESGQYTVPLRHMLCSSGKPTSRTPLGTFSLSDRHEWYDFNTSFARYATRYSGELLFHSVLYRTMDTSTLISSTVSELGTIQSQGCIRLRVVDAKWIYEYAESGTSVDIVSGNAISGLSSALPRN